MTGTQDFRGRERTKAGKAYDHSIGFRRADYVLQEPFRDEDGVEQLGCSLASCFRLVRKMCPFYMSCENEHKGKHWECNHGRTDAEYLARLAASRLIREPYLPENHHAAKPDIDGDEAGAGGPSRPTRGERQPLGQLYDASHHRRGEGQLSEMNGKRERAFRFVMDMPDYVGFSQGLRTFRGAGMGGGTVFKRLWKLRKARLRGEI